VSQDHDALDQEHEPRGLEGSPEGQLAPGVAGLRGVGEPALSAVTKNRTNLDEPPRMRPARRSGTSAPSSIWN
jgi:hypothetical protein